MLDWPEDLRVRQMPTGPWTQATVKKSTAFKAPAISPVGRTHAEAVAECAARSPEYREARAAHRRLGWSQAYVEDWAVDAKPHVRKAILLLACAAETMTTAELNAQVGSKSGGAIIGGLLRAATGRGLQNPLERVGGGWRFRSRELATMFAAALAQGAAARGGTFGQARRGFLKLAASQNAAEAPARRDGGTVTTCVPNYYC